MIDAPSAALGAPQPSAAGGWEQAPLLEPARAELVRRLSHDLRSPLNVLAGALGELSGEGPSDPTERARAVSLAQRALNRLTRLTERLTLAGRIDQGLAPVREQVELRPLVSGAWQRLQSSEPRSKISLELSGEACWPTDRALFCALVEELLNNALKNARATVSVRLEPQALFVEDDGAGVPEDQREVLFSSVQPRRAGLGLGLPMAAAVAKALALRLSVERTPKGSLARFTLRLP